MIDLAGATEAKKMKHTLHVHRLILEAHHRAKRKACIGGKKQPNESAQAGRTVLVKSHAGE